MGRCRAIWLSVVILLGSSWHAPVQAQTIEVAGGSGLAGGSGDGSFTSSYEPPLRSFEHSGRASQRLVLQRDAAPLLWGSLTWFGGPHVGVEGRIDYRRPGLHGANGPYAVTMTYVARQPPDYEPRQYFYETGLSAGAELHIPVGSRVAIVGGWRLFVPRLMELAVTADALAASDQGIDQLQWDDVQRTLAPAPVQWRPITSDLTAGLAVRF